ncbi:uncharacterized protein MONOS_18329 [Monocercomonoides exilis]|uniref:uncharacterized protein n=1 Tax=Monocercomonoides exilis TaxID=2049356 RepID=UPI003559813D|nr:hypothetical protein MONOS_18329 [Monocercomonoides exilis]
MHFEELFDEIGGCNEDEQKFKVEEMNELIEEMSKDEFETMDRKNLFDKITKKIEEKKLSMENAILLLKIVGYCKVMKKIYLFGFISDELISICVPYLLKVALKKEESEEVQKEVEMALLALCCAPECYDIEQKLYLNELKEIILYHQEHHNLTRLAYQFVWKILISKFSSGRGLEGMITKELHFVREARRELDELTRCIDWKRKDEKGEKETKEELALLRWIQKLNRFFYSCQMRNEENCNLIGSIVRVIRAENDDNGDFHFFCIQSLRIAAENRAVEVEDLLKGEAIDVIPVEIQRQTLNHNLTWNYLQLILKISERLIEKRDGETNKTKRKELKRKIFEKMEEEGYEDIITSFHIILHYLNFNFFNFLPEYYGDFLVNI